MSRVLLVTGAASGIGRRLCDRLVVRGDAVLACDVDEARLAEVSRTWSPARAITRRLDVRDRASWTAALDECEARFGRIDALMNVAGVIVPGRADETSLDALERQLDVNARGVLIGTRLASERMVRAGRGHVVNVGSLASLVAVPGLAGYSASKFAVRAFSLAAAVDLEPRGVAVSVVCPDLVDTPMLDAQLGHDEAALTFSGARALTTDEVVDALLLVLETRAQEVWLPRHRGWLARASDLFPRVARALQGPLARLGRRRQRELRASRGG